MFVFNLLKQSSPVGRESPSPCSSSGEERLVPTSSFGTPSIGAYRLLRVLGSGSHAKVHLGVHSLTGEKVAVKVIDKAHLAAGTVSTAQHPKGTKTSPKKIDPKRKIRIEREGVVMRAMAHPNVVKMVDVMETKESHVMVMELVEGQDLLHHLKKFALAGEGFPTERAFRFFYQLVSGLAYCHACGVAHRDIKCENILVDESSMTVKLTDFGLSNVIVEDVLMETACGSPHYAPPEILKGQKYRGAVADVWSLGVVLFVLYTGRLPFVEKSAPKLGELICQGGYVFPMQFDDEQLRELIERMLCVSTRRRITLSEIKEHPWWLHNCVLQGLDPRGIPGAMPMSPQLSPSSRGHSRSLDGVLIGSNSTALSSGSTILDVASSMKTEESLFPEELTIANSSASEPFQVVHSVARTGAPPATPKRGNVKNPLLLHPIFTNGCHKAVEVPPGTKHSRSKGSQSSIKQCLKALLTCWKSRSAPPAS